MRCKSFMVVFAKFNKTDDEVLVDLVSGFTFDEEIIVGYRGVLYSGKYELKTETLYIVAPIQ